jgi:hypothetical protein
MVDFTAEIPRIKRSIPHDLVNTPQVADGERGTAEGGRERGELQASPSPLHRVVQDLGVIEGEIPARLGDRRPTGAARIRAADWDRQVRRYSQVGHADHPASRVAVWCAVGAHLFQMQGIAVQTCLLAQFAHCGLAHVLAVTHEAARQGHPALVRLMVALDDEYVQQILAHRQDR